MVRLLKPILIIFLISGCHINWRGNDNVVPTPEKTTNSDGGATGGQVLKVETPVISPNSGLVGMDSSITITSATVGAEIYYNVGDGTQEAPDEVTGTLYDPSNKPLIGESLVVMAVAFKTGYTQSNVATAVYTVVPEKVADPLIESPLAGEVDKGSQVTISCATAGASIYYNTGDGTQADPDETTGTLYSAGSKPVIDKSTTIKAKAFKSRYLPSDASSSSYTVTTIFAGGSFAGYGHHYNNVVRANEDGSVDTSFETGLASNDAILVITPLSNGKVLIGGYIQSYNGVGGRGFITRINADGSLDTTFNAGGSGANRPIYAIVLQSDGKILIGGEFTSYNDVNGTYSRNHIARLNSDGSLDISFDPGTGATGTPPSDLTIFVSTIALDPVSNDIYVGGYFSDFNGATHNNIARLSSTGAVDPSFNTSIGSGPPIDNSNVQKIAIQSDRKVLLGGYFTACNGSPKAWFVRLLREGTIDATFNEGGSGANFTALPTVLPDGKILLAGSFGTYNGVARNYLARLNSNGTLDETFVNGNANGGIGSMSIRSDGKIMVLGGFTTYGGLSRNKIARVNTDGTVDATFSNPGAGPYGSAWVIAVQSDNKFLIGGWLESYNAIPQGGLSLLNNTGALVPEFNSGTGTNGAVYAAVLQSNGKILIGGRFSLYNGVPVSNISSINEDGTLDTDFNYAGSGPNDAVNSITVQKNGKILIAGSFTSYNGVTRIHVARLNSDGSIDASFNPSDALTDVAFAVALQVDTDVDSDRKILIGGLFTGGIKRFNNDGSVDTEFNAGVGAMGADGAVRAIAVDPTNGSIVIGGEFIRYIDHTGNYVQTRLTRLWNYGALDPSFNYSGLGANGTVRTIVIQPDGNILVGGDFSTYHNESHQGIVRLLTNGATDGAFAAGLPNARAVYSLALQKNGQILVGHTGITFNSVTQSSNHIARVNADGSVDTNFISNVHDGFNNTVQAIVVKQ
ncbi:MAG: chitobiase/beta-hexosaminidase C-terminal domain-containing protein [bacterium]